ncbi:MAG TPA: DUF5693 family protein, partial [Armatimonadota bacterium]
MPSNQSSSTLGLRRFCLLLMVLGLLAAGFGVFQRTRAERSTLAVDLVTDYNEVVALAGKAGLSPEQMIGELRASGATAVALPEETLDTMEAQGEISISPGPSLVSPGSWPVLAGERVFTVETPTAEVNAFIADALARLYPKKNYRVGAPDRIDIRGSREMVSKLGLGLSPQKVATITQGGLRVVPRLCGGAGLTEENLKGIFQTVAAVLPAAAPG